MRTLITCMGECLIDFLPLQRGEATVEFRMHPAGSLLNVAVSVVRLGQPAAFACKIADDYFGRFLRSYTPAAALNCTRAGANPPSCFEVEQFLASRL